MNQNQIHETKFFVQAFCHANNYISFKQDANYDFSYHESQDQYENSEGDSVKYEVKNQKNFEDKEMKNEILTKQIKNNEDFGQGSQYFFKNNNLIKNILKHFYKFLTNKENSQTVSEFIIEKPAPYSVKLIKKYFERVHYNNYSLVKIIKHQNYGKGFEYFLTFEAVSELYQSKVKNIQEHIDCIQYLKECCVNQEQINEINFYKKAKPLQL